VSYDPEAVRSRLTCVSLVAAAAAATGCGSGGGGGGTNTGGEGGPSERGAAYDGAFQLCAAGVKETAEIYAVEPNKEAIATVITELVAGGQARDEAAARQGCLDALDQAEKK
jgi:hypothetical protein